MIPALDQFIETGDARMKMWIAAAMTAATLIGPAPTAQANDGAAFAVGVGLGLFGGIAAAASAPAYTYRPHGYHYGYQPGYQARYYVEHPAAPGYVYRPYYPTPVRRVITTPYGYGVPGYVAYPRAVYRAAANRHQWCMARYRSYDPVSGTFVDNRGRIRQCL
jgi:BA14K-like protein